MVEPFGSPGWTHSWTQGLDPAHPHARLLSGHGSAAFAIDPATISHQLAAHLPEAEGPTVEITLSPEELGRVRMTISSTEGGLVLNLVADRADTLDLMRRHIDQLAQDFRAMGFERLSFAFGQNHSGQQNHNSPTGPTLLDAGAPPSLPRDDQPRRAEAPALSATMPDARLDLRF
ncbi:MAG: flagellar hook-length control protein FliK [Rhodobacteraceae bacterium]|nr:flagellar hook-length control protein FliK [Paracoccaceae bacterium]